MSRLLRPFVTGFRGANDPPLPETDFATFKSLCFEAARLSNGRVVSITHPPGLAKHHVARLALSHGATEIDVLLHEHVPIVAFRSVAPSPAFIDGGELATVFAAAFDVATKAELDAAPDADELNAKLPAAELTQVSSWKPKTVAEIVFNDWD